MRRSRASVAGTVEDIFTDILERVSGFCAARASWTGPIEGAVTDGAWQAKALRCRIEAAIPHGWLMIVG